MTDLNINPEEEHSIRKIAFLVALSCVLQISESLIPHPIPGLRLGLANVITLITLVTMGIRCALEVTVLRTILSSFIMGTFMSPTFILSFSGGVFSALAMGLLYRFSSLKYRYGFTIVGISIIGAFIHNITQIYLAYFVLIKHAGIFVFLPWLCLGSIVMGWVTGIASGRVCLSLKKVEIKEESILQNSRKEHFSIAVHHYLPGNSFLHRLSPQVKLAIIFILSLAVLIFSNLWFYSGLFLLLAVIAAMSLTSFKFLFSRARQYSSLILVSFLFPLFFDSGKNIFLHFSYFKVTMEGLNTGFIFALRILFLVLISALLMRTTAPKDLTEGLSRILTPLRPLGISAKRAAAILSLSWIFVPVYWDMAKNRVKDMELKKAKNLPNLLPLLSDFIAKLYLETGYVNAAWEGRYFPKHSLRKEGDEEATKIGETILS